ncbi:hypothetical protein [Acidisoma cladoniae]|uniref:hypothetical protein n=1 Tax=Acidisoma cladoniae TaxID=3040935 RepID=UPI00254C3EBD|nr:hypothetical protein [Acidisoma sp. PAMC 29798]
MKQPLRDDVSLFSTEELRAIYHDQAKAKGMLVRLGNGDIQRNHLRNIIRRRIWWERFGTVILVVVSVIGAAAAMMAAVESWRASK